VRDREYLVLPRLFVETISRIHDESVNPNWPLTQQVSGEAAPGRRSPAARVRIPYAPLLRNPCSAGAFVTSPGASPSSERWLRRA
jgi:hypothetical protein